MIPQPAHPWIPFNEMNDENQRKAAFVAECLEPTFVRATNRWVRSMRYTVSAESGEELVWVEVAGDVYLRANVTADSEWAMLKDVLRVLEDKYE